MIRFTTRSLAVLVTALVLMGSLLVPSAGATPGQDVPPPTYGGTLGKGATTVKYREGFTHTIGGVWTCTGVRVVNKDYTKDSFECTITNLETLPAGTYVNSVFGYGWLSDYDGVGTYNFTLIVTDNGDGTGHVEGVAYYA